LSKLASSTGFGYTNPIVVYPDFSSGATKSGAIDAEEMLPLLSKKNKICGNKMFSKRIVNQKS